MDKAGANTEGGSGSGGASSDRRSSGHSSTVGDQLVEAVTDVAADAKTAVGKLANKAREGLTGAAEDGKDTAADAIEDVAAALKSSADNLNGQHDWIAQIADKGAQELTSLAGNLRSNDLQGLLGALQDLAKRQPAIFAGAAIAAGFAAVRVGRVATSTASSSDLPKLTGST